MYEQALDEIILEERLSMKPIKDVIRKIIPVRASVFAAARRE